MNIVFQPPDSIAGLSGDLMSSSTSVSSQILADGAAANADQLGEGAAVDAKQAGTTPQGWDAYEVWRRFIKEARARRQQPEPN